MSIQQQIEQKLHQQLQPQHLEVINESNKHNVPPGSESHFRVVIVSDQFTGKNRIGRHRIINTILAHELAHDIHALAIRAFNLNEWQEQDITPTPPCLGGGK